MKFNEYKENLGERFLRYFDVEKDYQCCGVQFDLFAKSNTRNERYIATKKAVVYAFENNEYCLVKYFNDINNDSLDNFSEVLKNSIDVFVKSNEEHMSSVITGVIVMDNLDDSEIIEKIKKYKYQKSFTFGLKGWVDVRLVLVDLSTESVISSKKVNKVDKIYQP